MDETQKYNKLMGRLAGLRTNQSVHDAMMRVDHAGELGAVSIYNGQKTILQYDRQNYHSFNEIIKMEEQEKIHFAYFEKILPEQKIRPSLLYPIWQICGFGMGVVSALISKNNAMLCTKSVETVIGNHYIQQIEFLQNKPQYDTIMLEKFKNEELDHLNHALGDGANKAYLYKISDNIVQNICKIVIKIAQKF